MLAQENPLNVIKCASNIIKRECKTLCKRDSSSILRQTDYDSIFSFSWVHLFNELEQKCPGLSMILESIISDTPIPRDTLCKPFKQMMVMASMGLHSRCQEMSAAHYLMGFVMANGGCTQKVCQIIWAVLTKGVLLTIIFTHYLKNSLLIAS